MDKSCVIYRFNCFCERAYIGQTSCHQNTMVKEHIPKRVKTIIEDKTNLKSVALIDATRRSSIAEHSVNNPGCGKNYEEVGFKIAT